MNWMIVLCGIFYSTLCIFSIVTGIIYMKEKRKLNPIELSEKFIKKLDTDTKINKFTTKMGFITLLVGIIQGIAAISLFKGHNKIFYYISLGFTIFSILSVLFKLKSKINTFSLIKFIFYTLILIILLLESTRVYFNVM